MDLIRKRRCVFGNALIITQLQHVCPGVWLGTVSCWLIVRLSWGTRDPGRACIRTTQHGACLCWSVGFQCSVGRVGRVSVTYFPLVVKLLAQSAWFVISQRAMNGSVTSSTFSSEESFEYHEHNMWNPMLASLCHSEVGVVLEALLDEVDMGRITLSRHFSLDVLCDKTSSLPVVNDHVSVRNWPPQLPQHVETESDDFILGMLGRGPGRVKGRVVKSR